jgi:hypothetical protein
MFEFLIFRKFGVTMFARAVTLGLRCSHDAIALGPVVLARCLVEDVDLG